MSQLLPAKPSLVYLKKQAKDLLEALQSGETDAVVTFARYFDPTEKIGLIKAQLVVAREYGFASWPALKAHVATLEVPSAEAFCQSVYRAERIKVKTWWAQFHDELRQIAAIAAIVGDVEAVRAHLAEHPEYLQEFLPPSQRPLLSYACCSHLVKDPEFEPGIVEVVSLLLKAGADPNSGYDIEWGNEKWRETPLYGAAGVLNHAGITKLLLDAGADPDDNAVGNDGSYHGEALYHACDHPGQNECLRLILEANPSQVAKDYCIHRKLDFEDEEGIRIFLDHGVNLNNPKPRTALAQAVLRGRSVKIIQLMLEAGADPNAIGEDGTTPYVLARRIANREVAALLEAHGASPDFQPHDAILIAAADGDTDLIKELAKQYPEVLNAFTGIGRQPNDGAALGSAGQILHDLARLGHTKALRALLDLGMDSGLKNQYNETPLHWACVAGRAEAAKLLCERGAPLDVVEMNHHCIPVQWIYWGSLYWHEPRGDYAGTLEALLDAGQPLPAKLEGSPEVLAVLKARGAA